MNPATRYTAEALLAVSAVTLMVYGGYVVDALDRRLRARALSARRTVITLTVTVQLAVATASFLGFALLVAR